MRLIDSMPRSDKKDTTCVCCGYKFTRPAKLRQHYQSKKNQCNSSPEISSQKEGRKKANVPRPHSPSPAPAPVVHTKGKDQRKEKSKVVNPILEPQLVIQTPVSETESQKEAPILGLDYNKEKEAKNWINLNARKPGEHYKTWGKRLVQKWKELDLRDHVMPVNLNDCLTLYHDLEQYDPDAVRPLTLKELEKFSKVSPRDKPSEVKQQDGLLDFEAGSDPATQAYRERQKKEIVSTPEAFIQVEDIHFEECSVGRDLERPHENRSLMNKWVGKVPQPEGNHMLLFNQ